MKITTSTRLIGWAMALSLAGCGPATTGSTSSTTGGAPPPSGKSAATTDTAPKLTVPESLKYDSYVYNGFDRTTPLTYQFARMQGDKPEEGTQTTTLKSVDNGSATFEVTRDGSLTAIGDEELVIKPDGIYMARTSLGVPEKPVKVMPSDFKIGTVWTYDYVLTTTDGKKMRFKGNGKVVKEEKIKVAAGEYDTLMTTETATMDNNGAKGSVSSKSWYAKGIGAVRMKMEIKDSDGKLLQTTLELSKAGDN